MSSSRGFCGGRGWAVSGPPSGSGAVLSRNPGSAQFKFHHREVIKEKKIRQPRDCREGRQAEIGRLRRSGRRQNTPLAFRRPSQVT